MDQSGDPSTSAVARTLDSELILLRDAIAMVAGGGSPRVVVSGLRFGEALLEPGQALASAAGRPARPAVDARRRGCRHRRGAHRRWLTEPGPVLIVEDDESLRVIVARHLRSLGYSVSEAPSVEGAVEALDGGLRPAVVILDLNLPGSTGWDLLRGPSLAAAGSPPVVITSATTVSPKWLAEFGCAGYLPKPFPLDTLVATIERLIQPGGTRGYGCLISRSP